VKHRSDRSGRWQWETNSQASIWRLPKAAGRPAEPDRRTWQQSPGKGAGGELLQARSFSFRVTSEHSPRRWVTNWNRSERANGSNSGRRGQEQRRHFRPPDWGVAPSLHLAGDELGRGTVSGFLADPAGDKPTGGTSWLPVGFRQSDGWHQLGGWWHRVGGSPN